MKADIHPDYHPITIVMTDGTKYETRSTWGKAGDVLQLNVDPKPPSMVGGINLRKTGQMEKFTNKFAFLDAKPAAAPAAAAEGKAEVAAAPAAPKEEKKKRSKCVALRSGQ